MKVECSGWLGIAALKAFHVIEGIASAWRLQWGVAADHSHIDGRTVQLSLYARSTTFLSCLNSCSLTSPYVEPEYSVFRRPSITQPIMSHCAPLLEIISERKDPLGSSFNINKKARMDDQQFVQLLQSLLEPNTEVVRKSTAELKKYMALCVARAQGL